MPESGTLRWHGRRFTRVALTHPTCGLGTKPLPTASRRTGPAGDRSWAIHGGCLVRGHRQRSPTRASSRVIATGTFDFDAAGRIPAIHNVANPDRLQAIV